MTHDRGGGESIFALGRIKTRTKCKWQEVECMTIQQWGTLAQAIAESMGVSLELKSTEE